MKRFFLFLLLGSMFLTAGCDGELALRELPTLTALPTLTERPAYTLQPTYTTLPTDTTVPDLAAYRTAAMMDTAAPEPTYTPNPTLTPWPTPIRQLQYITVTPYQDPTAIPVSDMDVEFRCGDELGLTFSYMFPKIQQTLTFHYPVGSFMLMQIQLRSLKGNVIAPLESRSFTLLGTLWGREVRFDLDRTNSDYANSRWETPNLGSRIGSGSLTTFIVFDINPEAHNFVLDFTPYPTGSDTPLCSLQIPLPKVTR